MEGKIVVCKSTSTSRCMCGHSCSESHYYLAIYQGPGVPSRRIIGEWNRYSTRGLANMERRFFEQSGRHRG